MEPIRPVLHHVTFKTGRLNEMIAWYAAVVGMRVTFRNAGNAWTTNDSANHRIAFLSAPGLSDDPGKRSHVGLHHSAFEYGSFADLMSSYGRLRDLGIVPAFRLDHGMTFSLYYRDPDGNFVELQNDAYGDWGASSEWMRSSTDFAANPIGHFIDPDQVHRAHRDGASFEDIQAAVRRGAFQPATPPDIGLPANAPEAGG